MARMFGGFALAGVTWLFAKQLHMVDWQAALAVGLVYWGIMLVATNRWSGWDNN